MKNPGFIFLWLCSGAALVLACLKIMNREWLTAGLIVFTAVSVILMSVWVMQSIGGLGLPAALDLSSAGTEIQDGPIMMRWSNNETGKTLIWAFGYLVVAVVLAMNPGTGLTRVLSCAGVVALVAVTCFMMYLARDKLIDRIVADANGVEIHNKILDAVPLDTDTAGLSPDAKEELEEMLHETKVAWKEVGAVKIVSVYHRKYESRGAGSHKEFEGRELVLYGHNGKALMRLKDPLDPPQAYRRFLDSIPRWTKLTIQEASQTR